MDILIWIPNRTGHKSSYRQKQILDKLQRKTQIIQATLKAGSKSHNTIAHSLMHALLATTCNAFGMQLLLHCNTHSCDFEAEAFVFDKKTGSCHATFGHLFGVD